MALSELKVRGIKKTANETVVAASFDGEEMKHFIICNTPNDSTFDKTSYSNKTSLVLSDGTILHDMYDLDKLWYHNQAARQHMYPYEDAFSYQHVYKRPTTCLSSLTKLGDTLYALDGLATDGHAYASNELYKWLLNDNGWNVPPTQPIATMLYYAGKLSSLDGIAALSSQYNFSEELLSTEGIWPTSALLGVQYNTIYEIPGSIKQDYSKGELIANTFKAKNQYDETWTMQKPSTCHGLSAARQYTEIHSCGSTLWLKYKVSQSYSETTADIISACPKYSTQIQLSTDSARQTVALPNIEVVSRINRGADAVEHKSTLYSLDLRTELLASRTLLPDSCLQKSTLRCKYNPAPGYADSFLSTVVPADYTPTSEDITTGATFGSANAAISIDQDALDKVKATLANELKNCIRKLAESIAPANCQLFSVSINS